MKKLLAVLLVCLLAATLTGCKGEVNETTEEVVQITEQEVIETKVEETEVYTFEDFKEDKQLTIEWLIESREEAEMLKRLSDEGFNRLLDVVSNIEYNPEFKDGFDREQLEIELVNIHVDEGLLPELFRGMTLDEINEVIDYILEF